jgi:hypothetical protein
MEFESTKEEEDFVTQLLDIYNRFKVMHADKNEHKRHLVLSVDIATCIIGSILGLVPNEHIDDFFGHIEEACIEKFNISQELGKSFTVTEFIETLKMEEHVRSGGAVH